MPLWRGKESWRTSEGSVLKNY